MRATIKEPRGRSVSSHYAPEKTRPLTENLFPLLSIRQPNSQEDTSDWLLTDNVASWPGSPADRGWRYLKVALERYDGPETDHRYSKAALEAVLAHDRSSFPPPWLVHILEVSFRLFVPFSAFGLSLYFAKVCL